MNFDKRGSSETTAFITLIVCLLPSASVFLPAAPPQARRCSYRSFSTFMQFCNNFKEKLCFRINSNWISRNSRSATSDVFRGVQLIQMSHVGCLAKCCCSFNRHTHTLECNCESLQCFPACESHKINLYQAHSGEMSSITAAHIRNTAKN